MDSDKLFSQECIALDVKVSSKKQLFQIMAEHVVNCGTVCDDRTKVRDIVAAVSARERLGSTGFGEGVAIPHARLEGIDKIYAIFARLETPLAYEAVDDRPVDLVVLLLAPSGANVAHLRALARVSRLMRREDLRERLRSAPNAESVHLLLTDISEANAA